VRQSTLRIMARIDTLYLEDPCSGSRRMVAYLAREGIPISRDRVRNLMRRMGLRAIYQKPRTTVPGDPSVRFPCLVDLKQITAVDQVWATDITYIPLQKGFLYLVAIMDLHSRHVGPPEKVCGGQTDNELIPNQTETYGSSWGDLNI
jgi:putative transposase